MAEVEMIAPGGVFQLRRPHTATTSPLRAWSAADQLALDHLGTGDLGQVLVVNDEFGALTCGLNVHQPTVWTDSALSRIAIADNIASNGLEPMSSERIVAGDQVPSGTFDTVVVRIPKTSALLVHQLLAIAACTTTNSRIVGVGMARHIHRSTLESFEQFIGPTVTSKATRKARLIHPEPELVGADYEASRPREFMTADGVRVSQRPGTFSADHLDVGSALLLDVLAGVATPGPGTQVADLGCGNGVIAASIARKWTTSEFVLLDTSDLAISAARQTWDLNGLGERVAALAADGFADTADASVDIVITNPPFHQGHALDPELTDRLLADTARVLKNGGAAYVVAQRHLHLHTRMKQWFGSVQVASKHPSHVVIAATAPRRQ